MTALFTGCGPVSLPASPSSTWTLDTGTARICQQVQRIHRKGLVVKGLKTQASNATLDLLPDVIAALREVIGGRTSGLVWVRGAAGPTTRPTSRIAFSARSRPPGYR
jgi:hypothetical protein